MEKSIMKNILKLPIGYRFHPTDEEVIVHYLRRKMFCLPLPASVIPQLHDDFFQHDPWTLPGDMKEKRYFFARKLLVLVNNEKSKSKIAAASGSGYWKRIGKRRPILTCLNHLVGLKNTFLFCLNQPNNNNNHSSKFQWILYEFHLLGSPTFPHQIQVSNSKLGEWVVYSLSQRRRRPTITKQAKIYSKSSITNNEVIHSNFIS